MHLFGFPTKCLMTVIVGLFKKTKIRIMMHTFFFMVHVICLPLLSIKNTDMLGYILKRIKTRMLIISVQSKMKERPYTSMFVE